MSVTLTFGDQKYHLYLVIANDEAGDNRDWFVIAKNYDEAVGLYVYDMNSTYDNAEHAVDWIDMVRIVDQAKVVGPSRVLAWEESPEITV